MISKLKKDVYWIGFAIGLLVIIIVSFNNFAGNDLIQIQDSEDDPFWNSFERNVSIIAGFATAVALGFVAYETFLLRSERKMLSRAWIADTGGEFLIKRVFNINNDVKMFDEWEKMTNEEKASFRPFQVEWYTYLKNSGQIPTFDLQGSVQVVKNRIPKVEDISKKYGSAFAIMADEKHQFVWYTTFQDADDLLNENVLAYLIFDWKYTSANSKDIHHYGFVGSFGDGGMTKKSVWSEENKVQKIEDKDGENLLRRLNAQNQINSNDSEPNTTA